MYQRVSCICVDKIKLKLRLLMGCLGSADRLIMGLYRSAQHRGPKGLYSILVNLWNSLPKEAVEAASLNIFKTQLDGFLLSKGYGYKAGRWS